MMMTDSDDFMGGADLNAPVVNVTRTIPYRGEAIGVEYQVREMPDGSTFRIVGEGRDPMEIAREKYAEMKGLSA